MRISTNKISIEKKVSRVCYLCELIHFILLLYFV